MTAGQSQEALKNYQRSLMLDPNQPNAKRAIGKIFVDMREFKAAIKLFEEVRSKYADTPQLYPQLAKAQFYENLYSESAKNWAKAIEFFPDNLNYRVHEAQALYYSGDIEQALAKLHKIADEHRSWYAIDFLADDALASKNPDKAAEILEKHLTELRPQDEPRLLRLASIYLASGKEDKATAVVNRYLNVNPKNIPALLFKGDYLVQAKRPREAATIYQKILLVNPYAIRAYAGLAETANALGQYMTAVKYIRQARELNPTDPYWLLKEAHFLYQAGERKEAKKLILGWLKENKGPSLPVLLYHGLSPFDRDPILAYNVHHKVSIFEDHMREVKKAGYTPVTSEQVADWYAGKIELPEKPILISFDDARLDSFRYGDPILAKYGLKATMFAALVNVEGSLPPSFSPWEHMKRYEESGRWEIQSHGDLAHIHIPTDPEGRKGLFLINRQWLEKEQRYETLAEWRDRISADHQSAKQKIEQHLGHGSSGYAFPQGTFGQVDSVNSSESAAINMAAIRKYYRVAYTQDVYGMNVRTKDPYHVARIEPKPDWSGPKLIQHLQDQNPFVLAYRTLLRNALWENRTHEAYKWLNELKKQGASEPILLAEEGRLRSYSGDLTRAEQLAQRATELDSNPELKNIQTSIQNRMRPIWTPSFTYQEDNKDRSNWMQRQNFEMWVKDFVRLSLFQSHASFKDATTPRITDDAFGFGLARNFAIFHSASVQVQQHFLSGGNARDDISVYARQSSRWSDLFGTDIALGRSMYDTADALNANITERFANLSLNFGLNEWRVNPRLRASSLSDRNSRYSTEVEASYLIIPALDLRTMYQFVYDHAKTQKNEYYTPNNLRQHQLGLQYAPRWKRFQPFIRYLPGYGQETGVTSGFIQEVEVGLPIKPGERTSIGPYAGYVKTPTYHRSSISLIFSHQF
jgi:tetratricopeptide (TPR) repeat protein/peptidoglycan/xylan/chitin deacetylase (PgdA/CDA1 family)